MAIKINPVEPPIQRTLMHSDQMDKVQEIIDKKDANQQIVDANGNVVNDTIYEANKNFPYKKGREVVELETIASEKANLVTSRVESDENKARILTAKEAPGNYEYNKAVGHIEHAPVIDFDIPVKLVPSTQIGHYHLYIEKAIPWWQYKKVLGALSQADLIEGGYYKASVYRGLSAVRPSGSYKKDVPKDVKDVQNENAMLREQLYELTVERNTLAKKMGVPPQDAIPKAKVLTANA